MLAKLQKLKNLTYLFIAHDLSVVRFISDRIAVIYKGQIVELTESEKLFARPLHPYTRSLLSAIPIPNPRVEKNKVIEIYEPSKSHFDYKEAPPRWVEIEPEHFILANDREIEGCMKKLQ